MYISNCENGLLEERRKSGREIHADFACSRRASDGSMVARGDLEAQVPLEQVPAVQQKVVKLCKQLNKPVFVASQLLESMIEYPIPTRAEVADVSKAVQQGVDTLMLSGESAMGRYPEKALSALSSIRHWTSKMFRLRTLIRYLKESAIQQLKWITISIAY
ncbi:hypothetical protein EJB05_15413, partial [Eragrostis curvula]